jgi:hypothetical protein
MYRQFRNTPFLSLLFGLMASGPTWAAPVFWGSGTGHTNHWYEVVTAPNGISWEDAQADALSRGGYLATILSSEENTFVFNLVDSPSFWVPSNLDNANFGPWLGGFQTACTPEPSCGWTWVNSDGPFGFTAWAPGEPNNANLGESYLHFFNSSNPTRTSTWNDFVPQNLVPQGLNFPIAYVIEYNVDPSAVPEPAAILLTATGLFLLTRFRRPTSSSGN